MKSSFESLGSSHNSTPCTEKQQARRDVEALKQKLEGAKHGREKILAVDMLLQDIETSIAAAEQQNMDVSTQREWIDANLIDILSNVVANHEQHTDLTKSSTELDTLLHEFEQVMSLYPNRRQEICALLPEHLQRIFTPDTAVVVPFSEDDAQPPANKNSTPPSSAAAS